MNSNGQETAGRLFPRKGRVEFEDLPRKTQCIVRETSQPGKIS